ncbi:FAD/NAD(P)-binding domain-containing protein [Pisolithus croceorrhizus]|nr:FAD/NAD(P)-binding domain-containing protein [Pisolithus croceorrhizus]KAI6132485.1 FAD/NAD(P)-binding domain-containing protein [Pisolithus croceorrhizus]KAI6168814.1 FAD/NAD(P)-binding domain-containing protein [Pisolithus thermaeus]
MATATQTPVTFLPTLQRLGSTVDPVVDAQAIANAWFTAFADAVSSQDATAVLVLTWDYHTYEGGDKVKKFPADQLPGFNPSTLKLHEDFFGLQTPFEDLAWIQGYFTFDTTVGHASGIFRLVPLANGSWKGRSVYTNLEGVRGFPEKIIPSNNPEEIQGKPAEARKREQEYLEEEPSVIIVGGGHSGLDAAARLKALDVKALIIERNERIGDNWRNRYAALRLHDPGVIICLTYHWLESYAHILELKVWTSTKVVSVEPGTQGMKWSVKVVRGDGRERFFEVNHVVFALGISSDTRHKQDEFKGRVLHSSKYKVATDHLGKKVVVVGACTSAHDICSDYADHGVDVTMVQRTSTYVMSIKNGIPIFLGPTYSENGSSADFGDRLYLSFPNAIVKLLHQRVIKVIAEADKDILDGLRKVGFKLNMGEDGPGIIQLAMKRLGGYYVDDGASQKIIDGKIKLKADGHISRFTPTGLLFKDGSALNADVVVFATGYGDAREAYLQLLPADLHSAVQPIWGLNEEGELNSVSREVGGHGPDADKVAGLWSLMGNLAMSRFFSKHVTLQIKAYQEGVFAERY